MDLQVKKLKLDISATPMKNSITGLYHHPQGRDKLLISPLRERTKETYFEMYCFKSMFLRH